MKEKKTKILLLSALAAMTLASCGGTPQVSSNPSNSSADPASAPASSEPVQESKSSQAPVDDSKPAEQSEDPVVVSDDQPAQSIPEQPSSEEQELQDWVGQAFVGQYQGGFTGLIINEDKSTSWDTDRTHYPAILEVLDNGIYHIYSADTVPSEEKVDVYTDGTMAYLTHDAVEKDAFIVDKGAEYEAANAMAKKADDSLIFGSIMAGNKLKFFRAANGVFDFDIKVDVNYGASIEALGAIFDVTVGDVTATYRTTVAGNAAAGQYAIIEDYQIVITVYGGMEGELVVARNQGEIVYVTLDGVAVDPELISEEDGAITIKGAERVLDQTDMSNMQWVYSATKYILDEASHTYESEDATSREAVFHVLDMNETQFTAEVGADGNLWATFTPSVSGFFNVNIISGTGDNDYYSYSYDYIAIYRADAESYGSPYNYAEEYAYYYEDYYGYDTEEAAIENFLVTAGVTYVIKASNNDDIYNVLGDDDSEHEGESITIGYSYTAFDVVTYNGDNGALVIESYNGTFRSAILNGQPLDKATFVNNVLTAKATVIDFDTNPANPQRTITTITITVDPTTGTYVYESASETDSVFHVLTEEDSGTIYQTVVGEDGNLWAAFTPSAGGYLTVEETISTTSDGYLAIFESTAASFTDNYSHLYAVAYADSGAALSGAGKITNLLVKPGVTYIIKAGAYRDREKDLGDTGSSNAGMTEAISFVFSSLLTETYTGDDGDLVLSTENGAFRSASIGGQSIAKAELVENGDGTLTLSAIGDGTFDLTTDPLDPTKTSTDTVYTLDVESKTYTAVSSTVTRHLFQEVTSSPALISGNVESDGNLWAKFTPDVDGYLTVEETVSVSTDGYISIYESTAAAFTDNYSHSYAVAYADKFSSYNPGLEKVSNLAVTAGVTYIIKVGAYNDRDKVLGHSGTASTSAGNFGEFKVTFDGFDVKTYTGDAGALVVNKAGDTLVSATLGGTALVNASIDEDGNIVVKGAAAIDNTDPLNPTKTSTDTVYTLDAAGTYTVDSVTSTDPIFHEVTETAEVSDVVGADGNLWIKFTAPSDGEITIEELAACSTDGYLAIYESTASSFATSNKLIHSDANSGVLEKIEDYAVESGKTYIIKIGAYADRDKLVTATGSSYAGKTESVMFTFAAYAANTYTNEEGADLIVNLKGDEIVSVTLGGVELEGAELIDGNIVIAGEVEEGVGGALYQPVLTYLLDDEGHTYALVKESIPFVESSNYEIAQGSNYFFAYDEEAGTYTSNNAGVNSSSATMTITVAEDGYLSFDYDVESEGSYSIYDYLEIKVNGVVLTGYGKLGGSSGATGHVLIKVNAGDVITFTYSKDSSTGYGRDNAIISNISYLVVVVAEEEEVIENPIENPDLSNE